MREAHSPKKATSKSNPFLFAVGVFLCVVFGTVLICNLTIIAKSHISPEEPPSVLGIAPFTVVSGSMSGDREGHLEIGDLLLVQKVDAHALKVGDVISFVSNGTVTTHRIVEIAETGGKLQFITKGDANNTKDQAPVSEDQLVGRYLWRIPKLGNFALFLREPLGMVLFVVVPLMLFVFIDFLSRRLSDGEQKDEEQSELALENARLRAMLEEQRASAPSAVQELTPVTEAAEQPMEQAILEIVADPIEDIPVTMEEPAQPEEFVCEVSKTQENDEVSIEEILAFARSLEI